MQTPEDRAREEIDRMLNEAGWTIQDRDEVDLSQSDNDNGVAVREFQLTTGDADYILFVNRQPVGAIEAKKFGDTLSGVENQTNVYAEGLPDYFDVPFNPLPFHYQSTGIETYFTNLLDPTPRSRRVFHFHRPKTIAEFAREGDDTLRARLQTFPPLDNDNLWPVQRVAIQNLEVSMALNRPRALIQMATGSGKTYTAVNSVYRLIKYGKVRRVLFLVDRNNLGKQAYNEFQTFRTPDDGRIFTELYNVQRLTSNALDPVSKVCISTIQRVYSLLKDEELAEELENASMFVDETLTEGPLRTVSYNPHIPIEYFDVIIIDECHRSIYNLWRQVLEYFDAFLIGLTATPSKSTIGFFNQNLVMEYSRPQAVLDGVNVDSQVYTIRTRITEKGSEIEAGYNIKKMDRRTREERGELLDEDFAYTADQLDVEAISRSQLRTVVRTFRDRLFTDIFPDRKVVPKTLVFAKDDTHAEEIVRVIREEFDAGNDFCKKITYKVSKVDPEDLIAEFRTSFYPRIAVSVDMIATGTDIKPVEILLFMRLVKSPVLYEQMQGRGTRVIDPHDLQAVTPDAEEKTHFVIVDTVGVVDTPKAETPVLEQKPHVPFDKLLDQISFGNYADETFTSMARRLARLSSSLTEQDREAISEATGGVGLKSIADVLLHATDYDVHIERAKQDAGCEQPTPEQIKAAEKQIKQDAADILTPQLRKLLKDIQSRSEIVIDEISIDSVLEAGFSTEEAELTVQSFERFIEENKNEITALQIMYNRPYGERRLTWNDLKELEERLKQQYLNGELVWRAYAQLEGKPTQAQTKRALTDLVSLVRHAIYPKEDLLPHPTLVKRRYETWLAEQEAHGRDFSEEQRWWLDQIAEHIGVNLSVELGDLETGEFYTRGGRIAAIQLFGNQLQPLLQELNRALAA